jgi:hypothetical protein
MLVSCWEGSQFSGNGVPHDVVLAVWLGSPDTTFLTGIDIPVDAGFLAQ